MVTQNTLRTLVGKEVFYENQFIFATVVDLSKCLKQFKVSLHICAPILSYHFSAMQKRGKDRDRHK